MSKFTLTLAAALCGAVLTGCAGVNTVQNAGADYTNSRTFPANLASVQQATTKAIPALNLNLKSVNDTPTGAQVIFSKPMSIFSWGEVGRIDLIKVDETKTKVAIQTEKRLQAQITGTTQADFAKQIFSEIETKLSK